jgi:hypothetical protein
LADDSAFTGVTLAGRDFGCFPTAFSADPSATTPASPVHVIASDGCTADQYDAGAIPTGSALVVLLYDEEKESSCSVSQRVALAKQAGGVGVVLRNYIPGEIPYMLSWARTELLADVRERTTSSEGIDMFACMIGHEDGNALAALVDLDPANARLEWSKFQRWASADEPTTGTHSVFSVLSPKALKDDWPAAQALFNPKTHAAVSAGVVVADYIDDCVPRPRGESKYLSFYCRACWAAQNKFKNPASEIAQSILLFREPYSICFPGYYDLGYIAQGADAAAVVVSTPSNGLAVYLRYHVVPYKPSIPLLAVQHYIGFHIEKAVDEGTAVHALVHAITNHRGPSYYPPSDFHQALPETDLTFTTASCTDKTAEIGTVQGGQSTFNPDAVSAVSGAEIVRLGLAPECARAGGAPVASDDMSASTGVDCAACLRALADKSAVVGGNLTGKVAFVEQWEAFCTNSLLDIAAAAAGAGAVGVVVGNQRDLTMTVSGGVAQGGKTSSTIPMFNVRRSVADAIQAAFQDAPCALQVSLPAIRDGKAAHTSSSAYNDRGGTVTPTQIRFRQRGSRRVLRSADATAARAPGADAQKGFQPRMVLPTDPHNGRDLDASNKAVVIEVGQTLFEPRSHPGLLSGTTLVRGGLLGSCGANSCSKCALYDSPLSYTTSDGSDYKGKVVTFSMANAHCIRPMSQYVYFAQQAQAVGVLFLSDSRDAHLETLGPATVDFTPTIPSFVVPKGMFSEAYYTWEMQAPAISNGVASETVGSWPAPVSPISESGQLLDQDPPGESDESNSDANNRDDGGGGGDQGKLNLGLVTVLIILISACCCCTGWKTGKILFRRNQRGKLLPIGRMTHSTNTSETQTGARSESRILIGNADNFSSVLLSSSSRALDLGLAEEEALPSEDYGGVYHAGGSVKDAFEEIPMGAAAAMAPPPSPPTRSQATLPPSKSIGKKDAGKTGAASMATPTKRR